MASFPSRSTSMPSRPHPLPSGIAEELDKLKSLMQSSCSTTEAMLSNLEGLAHLYATTEDLLHLPLSRQAVARLKAEGFIHDMLDGYVRLLDACNTMRETLTLARECARAVHSAVRRRAADIAISREADVYLHARKKAWKEVDKCLKAMRTTMDDTYPSLVLDVDPNLLMIIGTLREVNSVSISIFRTFLVFLTSQRSMEMAKTSRWSLVSRVLLKGLMTGKKANAGDEGNQFDSISAAMYAIRKHPRSKETRDEMVQISQRKLEKLEICTEKLELAVQSIFRKIVQNRVSLLNILSM